MLSQVCKRGTIWVNSRYTTGVPFLSRMSKSPLLPPPSPPPPSHPSQSPWFGVRFRIVQYRQSSNNTVSGCQCLCSFSSLSWTTNQVIIPSNIPCSSPFEISVKICHQELSCNHPITDRDSRHRVVKLSKYRLLMVN